MKKQWLSILGLIITVIASALPAVAQRTPLHGKQAILFTVSMPKPQTHLLEVEIQVRREVGNWPTEDVLVMPVWTPGSYLIRDYPRNVQDFAATDRTGVSLEWEKINKNSWKVKTNALREWRVAYRVYANEFSVRTNELNADHAFWNNTALLMYLKGFLDDSPTLRILPPPSWKVATAIPSVPGEANTFRAENFDVLYDSPVEVSNFVTVPFEVKGVAHRIVIDGAGNYDPERIRRDVQKIVATEIELMGGEVPYHDYTFILHLRSNASGGLEHRNSCALGFPRFNFQSEGGYRSFLSLVAHEFFHLWNVKRIRPDVLGPFDYSHENYTKLLWVVEGITEYYARISLLKAALISPKDFLTDTAKAFQSLQNTPGRLAMSLEEGSFDAWIKLYRPDENSVNSQVSYYDKGLIVGLLLDLEIRKNSHGAKSLDDVMRYLYAEFYKKDRNYGPEDFQRASELMAGSSLQPFFAKYVHGRDELDYNTSLAAAGLRLDVAGTTQSSERAYLGADLVQNADRLIVGRIYAGTPAYEQGLSFGDQIVAINNMRANREFFEARIAEKKPGDVITLTIFRSDDLRTLMVTLGARSDVSFRILAVKQPSDEQKQIYQSWLSASLE